MSYPRQLTITDAADALFLKTAQHVLFAMAPFLGGHTSEELAQDLDDRGKRFHAELMETPTEDIVALAETNPELTTLLAGVIQAADNFRESFGLVL